jgi:hypothetical protein
MANIEGRAALIRGIESAASKEMLTVKADAIHAS